MKVYDRKKAREKRHSRIRSRVFGTSERPRLVVNRSLKNLEGQVVDDEHGKTILGMSSLSKELDKSGLDKKNKVAVSKMLGLTLARRAVEKGIKQVVFDRGGYIYHGRVRAFAEGAREGGLEF
ncbi:MAG: 50S ribosomal protein L18 [Candidatus Glassbacteria bacterium]|nr:50S ribosomal protein L18 [Candidatus Glassbacteria bacterium]